MSNPVNLPNDVGLCLSCSARNSKHATKCHSCGAVLPWVQKKVAAAAPKPFNTKNPSPVMVAAPASSNFFNSIDWGSAIVPGLMMILMFVVSLSCPIVGVGLYRYFNNEDNSLKYACGAGLVVVFVGFLARFCLIGISGVHATEK